MLMFGLPFIYLSIEYIKNIFDSLTTHIRIVISQRNCVADH